MHRIASSEDRVRKRIVSGTTVFHLIVILLAVRVSVLVVLRATVAQ